MQMLVKEAIYNDTIPEIDFGEDLELVPETVKHEKLTPAKVLSWLPADATPAQQDSAIQAHFKPGVIHWSECPDTLRLPLDNGYNETSITTARQFLRESFFARDSIYNPEVKLTRYGVAGDPVPYTVAGDNLITSLLIGCFILAMLAFTHSRQFIVRQAKNFFRTASDRATNISETTSELRFQLFLVLQTCLLFAIVYFFYRQNDDTTKVFLVEQYELIGIYGLAIAAYFIVKAVLYHFVDWVFFDSRKNELWMKSYLFLISTEGILLFPAVMLQAYFQMSVHATVIYVVTVIIIIKILSLYRCFVIFLGQKYGLLQIILYFCTLELTPLLTLWTLMDRISEFLTINY